MTPFTYTNEPPNKPALMPRLFAAGIMVLVSACASPSNRILDRDDAANLGNNGAVLFKFTRDDSLKHHNFSFVITRLGSSTGRPINYSGTPVTEVAMARLGQRDLFSKDPIYFSYSLPPGEYGISHIRDIPRNYTGGIQGTHAGVGGGGGLLGALIVVAFAAAADVGTIIERNKHKEKTGVFPGEINFSYPRAIPPIPSFMISPGRVTYIGDFHIKALTRLTSIAVSEQLGPQPEDQIETTRTIEDLRKEVAYQSNPRTAKRHASQIGLASRPMESISLAPFNEQNLVLRDFQYPPDSSVKLNALKQASPVVQKSPTRSKNANDTTFHPTNLKELIASFLQGEITKSQYDEWKPKLR